MTKQKQEEAKLKELAKATAQILEQKQKKERKEQARVYRERILIWCTVLSTIIAAITLIALLTQ